MTTAATDELECVRVNDMGCRHDHQLGEHARVALPDDLDTEEDRDEQGRNGEGCRAPGSQVGKARPGPKSYGFAEALAEDEQLGSRLDGRACKAPSSRAGLCGSPLCSVC